MSTTWITRAPRNGSGRPTVATPSLRLSPETRSIIAPVNLRAMSILYYSAMIEEARLFQTVDRLVGMFIQGELPLGGGPAGEWLYKHWRQSERRLSASQREALYNRAFGLPGESDAAVLNREFEDLWLRFLGTVGMYSAELQALPASARSVTPEEVRRSARDLAQNLSCRGAGAAIFAARELQRDIQQMLRLASDPELERLFGVNDPWQLIERFAACDPGARPNIARSRKRAESGRIIIRWLANHVKLLTRQGPVKIIKESQLRDKRSAGSIDKQRLHPTDHDLAAACEQWLAVTGTEEDYLPS